jgi:hypothetical protein
MESRNQGIIRTFTFRNFSPAASETKKLKIEIIPNRQQLKISSGNINYSQSSESLELSTNDKKFPIKRAQNLDELLDKMIKEYKVHKSIPESFVSNLPLENYKIIVEKLIKEKLSLQEDLNVKENEAEFEKDSIKIEKEMSSSVYNPFSPNLKMQAFRALENVSPIEEDDSNGHTNYKIISLPLTPKEDFNPDSPIAKSRKYESYKKEAIKLTTELKDLSSYNKILKIIISLDKNKESFQFNQQIREKINTYTRLSTNIAEELKTLKNIIQPNEGFLENIPLHRKELKILSKMVGYNKKCDMKPSEMETINKLLDLKLESTDKIFEEYVDELLAGHDIAEIASIFVKYIKFLEEEASIDLKTETLNCLITEFLNEAALEDAIDQNLVLSKEKVVLENEINRISYEKNKNFKLEQVKIRTQSITEPKNKWKLPLNLQNLSGPELYSKTLARLKNFSR